MNNILDEAYLPFTEKQLLRARQKKLNPQVCYVLKNALNIIKDKSYKHKSLESPLEYLKKYYVLSYVLIYELLDSKIALLARASYFSHE